MRREEPGYLFHAGKKSQMERTANPSQRPAPRNRALAQPLTDTMKLVSFEKICNDAVHETGELDFIPTKSALDILSIDQDEIVNAITDYISSLRSQVSMLGRERTLMTLREINASCNSERRFDEDGRPVRVKREKMRRPQSRGVTGRRRMDATEMGTLNPYVGYVPRSRIQNSSSTIGLGSASGNKDSRQLSYGDSAKKYMPRRNVPVPQYSNPPTGNSDDDGLGGFVDED